MAGTQHQCARMTALCARMTRFLCARMTCLQCAQMTRFQCAQMTRWPVEPQKSWIGMPSRYDINIPPYPNVGADKMNRASTSQLLPGGGVYYISLREKAIYVDVYHEFSTYMYNLIISMYIYIYIHTFIHTATPVAYGYHIFRSPVMWWKY